MTLRICLKVGQSMLVGDDVTITLGEKSGKSATLLVDAPQHIPVDRESVREWKRLRERAKIDPDAAFELAEAQR